jgi:hypothetical protein
MKKLIVFVLFFAVIVTGCKQFKMKKLFSKDTDTMLTYDEEEKDTSDTYTGLENVQTESNMSQESLKDLYRQNPPLGSKKAYMIVGSFRIPQNADKYAEKIRAMGYTTEIVQARNGYHMVAASAYDNLRDGVREIPRFRSEVSERAWVYLKR